ncbi:MAG: DUF192 domain-containing protein [Thermomicrobiales bacterium]
MSERLVNERTGATVLTELERARGAWGSFRGLMLRKSIPAGYGLLFTPAQGIHTQFMRFPIDLIFLDHEFNVVKIHEAMPPWRYDFKRAAMVIETAAGAAKAADIREGDRLLLVENE